VPARPIENEGAQTGDRKIMGVAAECLQNVNNSPPVTVQQLL